MLGLVQDSDFAGDFEDSKSTSGGALCVFGSHTFVPISWMCKKQTSVSHSSTESEIISLDAGLRLDGIPALDLWDLIVSVLGNMTRTTERTGRPVIIDRSQKSQGKMNVLNNIDCVLSNVQSSHQGALLYVFEDNEAVIKMIIKGRSPTVRHVSKTHRVALDWLFDRINLDPKIQIKYIDTKNQLADILTKGNFTRDEWNHLLCLFDISHFSSTVCSDTMAKRSQHDSGEERVTAKSRPMMSLFARAPSNMSSLTSESPGKRSCGNQDPGRAGHPIPCRGAEAVSHGPDCSADHGDALGHGRRRPYCVVVRDILVVPQRPISIVLLTMEIPQFLFDKMVSVPVEQVERVPQVWQSCRAVLVSCSPGVLTASCGTRLVQGVLADGYRAVAGSVASRCG